MSTKIELVLADAHVHLHERLQITDVLESAQQNFSTVAEKISGDPVVTGVLFLTESINVNYFKWLASHSDLLTDSGWNFESTAEPVSLIAKNNKSIPLVIVAGRQIVTAERLEVLALGTTDEFPDGKPIRDTLKSVVAADAVPVIPWAFGKWMGHRGRLLRSLLEESKLPRFFLGDNSSRPAFFPRPREFEQTRSDARHILSGSDQLPFPSEFNKPGSFGFSLKTSMDLKHPLRSLASAIGDPASELRGFGKSETALNFIRNQVKMQIQMRQERDTDT